MPYRKTGRSPGRPRHPEPLTPAEQRVLDQVRLGLSNAEIAVRLGVSPETVKSHVSNMLTKLDLPDRHALAAWSSAEPPAWKRIAAAPAALFGRVGEVSAWRWVAGAFAVAAVVFGVVAVAVILRSGSNATTPVVVQQPGTPQPTSIATPQPCGTNWAHESRLTGDPPGTLTASPADLPWTPHLPQSIPAGFELTSVQAMGVRCRPSTATLSLEYTGPDGRVLRFFQQRASLTPIDYNSPSREIDGEVEVIGDYIWRYIVLRHEQPDGSVERSVEFAHEVTDGLSTYLALTIGADEDRTIDELQTIAFSLSDYPPPPPRASFPVPVEYSPEPMTWDLTPAECADLDLPNEGQRHLAQERGRHIEQLPGGLALRVGQLDPRQRTILVALIDTASGSEIHFDERGRRIRSYICTPEALALFREAVEEPDFRERVRALGANYWRRP